MPLISLLDILKKQFVKFFILPVLFFIFAFFASSIVFNLNKKKNEDIAYMKIIEKPLVNSMLLFQPQEVQFLLNSISQHLKWSSAFLINDENVVLSQVGEDRKISVGFPYGNKCINQIILKSNESVIGRICYSRDFWSLVDVYLISAMLGLVFFIFFILFFYLKLLKKLNYFFKKLTLAVDAFQGGVGYSSDPEFIEEKIILKAVADKIELVGIIKQTEIDNIESIAKYQVAAQVAHDIRSPLAVLNTIKENVKDFPLDNLLIMKNAIERINAIANGLLSYNGSIELQVVPISPLVHQIVAEKKIQYSHRRDVEILDELSDSQSLLANINSVEFCRMLSNIINNSVEAMFSRPGSISIRLFEKSEKIIIEVEDNGIGMSEQVQKKLGQAKFTSGKISKESGFGLGISHALSTVKLFSGEVFIESKESVGTRIIIELPKLTYIQNEMMILIDDDDLVRVNWEWGASKKNIKLRTFSSEFDFFIFYNQNKSEVDYFSPVYIDLHLSHSISGQDVALKLKELGFKNINYATGYDPKEIEKPDFVKSVIGKKFPF